jgi:hypothetical protein
VTIIRVATLPTGIKDVDQLLSADGGDAQYERMVAEAEPAPLWMIHHLEQRHDLGTVQGAVDACEDMVDVLLRQPPVARARYVRELAAKIGEDEHTVRQTLNEAIRDRDQHYQAHPEDRPLLPNPALLAARVFDV